MSLNDTLADYFTHHPNVWIDGMVLAKIAGSYAWRSRCADLRKRGMKIENRVRKVYRARTTKISEYRYVPAPVTTEKEQQGHNLNDGFQLR